MEFILLYLLIGFFAVFGVIGVGFAIVGDSRHDRLAKSWAAYAARRRYTFTEGEGQGRTLRVDGTRGGVEFWLQVEKSRVTGDPFIRLVVPAAPAAEAVRGRVVATRGRARHLDGDGDAATTDDPHFDSIFDVRGPDEPTVRRVLGERLTKALQRFPPPMFGEGLRFSADAAEIAVEWSGDELDTTKLDAAHAIVQEARHNEPGSTDTTNEKA